jgi:hypothetical protein
MFRGPATTVLVEALLYRGSTADVHEAHEAVNTLAAVPTDAGFVLHELHVLRMRALLARACGAESTYREFADRYRKMARPRFRGAHRLGCGDDMRRLTGPVNYPVSRNRRHMRVSKLCLGDACRYDGYP